MALSGSSSGGGAGAGAIRAGAAFVEIFARDKVGAVLDKIAAKFQHFGSMFMRGGAAIGAAGLGILGGIGAIFKSTIDRGAELSRLAEEFGTTTEAISALGYAAETAGVKQEEFGNILKDLHKNTSQAAAGSEEQAKAFQALGLSARALMAMPLEERFGMVADSLDRLADPSQRAEMAMKVLGEAGLKMLPALKGGAAGLKSLTAEAAEVGAIMDGETAARADDLGKTFQKTWLTIKYAIMEVGAALLPQADQIKDFAGTVRTIAASVREWINDNKAAVLTVVAAGAALVAAGAAGTALGAVLSGLGAAIGVVAVAVKALGAAVALLLSPIGLVVAALGTLGYLWATQTDKGKAYTASLKSGFLEAADTAKQAWGGIAAALRKGDIGLAAEIAFGGIKLEWLKLVKWWTGAWNSFKGMFVDGWHAIGTGLRLMFTDLAAFILRNTVGVLHDIVSKLAWAAEQLGAGEVANALKGVAGGILSDKEINAGRDQVKTDELNDFNRRQKARDESRERDLAAAQADIDAARARLDELIARANVEQAKAEAGAIGGAGGPNRVLPPPMFDSIRGTFSAYRSADILGTGPKTIMQLQLKEQQKTNEKLDTTNDELAAFRESLEMSFK